MAARILEMEQAYERVAPPTPSRMPTILAALLGVAGFAAAAVSLGSSVQLAASMREMQELGRGGRGARGSNGQNVHTLIDVLSAGLTPRAAVRAAARAIANP